MKLKIQQSSAKAHKELAGAVGWNVAGELFSCSDDKSIQRWNSRGEPEGKVGWDLYSC